MQMKAREPVTDYAKLDKQGTYTYLDYIHWHFEERVELFKGKIFKMSPAPNVNHQTISLNLASEFRDYFRNKTCKAFMAPFDVRLFPLKSGKDQTVVQPDACVICDEKKLDKQGCLGAPDLVVEILSPGNSRHELDLKFQLYEESGVKEYWIIEPSNKTILVYRLLDGTFSGSKPYIKGEHVKSYLFPEMHVPVDEIFHNVK
jgi:Uma2 family endonuclease